MVLLFVFVVSMFEANAGLVNHPVFGAHTYEDSDGLAWSRFFRDEDQNILKLDYNTAAGRCAKLGAKLPSKVQIETHFRKENDTVDNSVWFWTNEIVEKSQTYYSYHPY